jgi:hypothetical protein
MLEGRPTVVFLRVGLSFFGRRLFGPSISCERTNRTFFPSDSSIHRINRGAP